MRLLLLLVVSAGRGVTKAVAPCSTHASRRRRLAETREAGKRNMMMTMGLTVATL
jgi:hypothetical protein